MSRNIHKKARIFETLNDPVQYKEVNCNKVMMPEKLNSVLCINDNDITLFILKRTLSKTNFAEKIVERNDGREALNYCRQLIKTDEHRNDNYPKVIFLDLHMPVMNGWEFLDKFSHEIWPFFKETKVIITSQSIDAEDSVRAKEYPFVLDFLKTSITTDYLTRLHERVMSGYSFHA